MNSGPLNRMSANRFSMLSMDDDEEEIKQEVKPVVQEVKKEVREWKLTETPQMETRQWNTDGVAFPKLRHKRAFARGYAFRDDTRPPTKLIRGYGFKDDSPPVPETLKPTTPTPLEIDFPKLSGYDGPKTPPYPKMTPESHTPPYPPNEEPILTLAEKIKRAMEQHVSSMNVPEKETTIEMYTVIPIKTTLASDLQLAALQR